MDTFEKIIEIVGSQYRLAKILNISAMAVTNWKNRRNIPQEHWEGIEFATGGKVSAFEIYKWNTGNKAA